MLTSYHVVGKHCVAGDLFQGRAGGWMWGGFSKRGIKGKCLTWVQEKVCEHTEWPRPLNQVHPLMRLLQPASKVGACLEQWDLFCPWNIVGISDQRFRDTDSSQFSFLWILRCHGGPFLAGYLFSVLFPSPPPSAVIPRLAYGPSTFLPWIHTLCR